MKPESVILGNGTSGPLRIDVARLLETRMLIQGSSGSGKSRTIRRLLEQTHGHAQHLVIDVEGDFATLRERFDYVLAGRGGDCPADPRSAALLARKLLELRASAILDIYELPHPKRLQFVAAFLGALMDAPKELRHPCLVVIDEAQMFCAEQGRRGGGQDSAACAAAVIDLMTRGRKRGLCGILATLRLSKLDKDAAAECLNKAIGLTNLDADLDRAAAELGFSGRDDKQRIRRLESGHFFCYGPALCRDVAEIHIGDVATTHPKVGQRVVQPPPPPVKVRSMLASLAELPAEAEQEARSLADAQRRIRELERELKAKPVAPAPPPPERVEVPVLDAQHPEQLLTYVREARATADLLADSARLVEVALQRFTNAPARPVAPLVARERGAVHAARRDSTPPAAARAAVPRPEASGAIGKGERIVLTAVAQHDGGVTREQLTVLTGYKRSTRDAYVQRLRVAELVEDGSMIVATQAGFDALGPGFEPLPTGPQLREHWLKRLPDGERRILEVLHRAWPGTVDREAIGEATEFKRSTRDAYLQRLGARRVVEFVGRGEVRMSEALA